MSEKQTEKPIVLTIAGFDPSSGAGLTADIRTFENIGVYGMSICTAITIQNAEEVKEWVAIDKDTIRKQLDIILGSYNIKYVKTGMLGTIDAINLVEEYQKKYNFHLIIDPVVISGSGHRLATDHYEKAIKEKLFPIAEVVTPNRFEAELFSGKKITDALSVQDVCGEIFSLGPKNVIVKGGHIDENQRNIVDYLFNESMFRFYPRERVIINNQTINNQQIKHIHGTGCVFSALITGFLALGYDIEECIFFTEDFMEEVFRKVFPLKRGMVLDVGYSEEEIDVLKAVQKIMDFIGGNSSYSELVPEVRTNIAVSKKDAKNLNQIAGVEGRITLVNGLPVASGPIKFGATNHTGRLLLEAKKYDNDINVVINIKYKPEIILKLADTNFCMIDIDRLKQSSDGTKKEDTTMGWLVREAYESVNRIPDIIWDSGEPGKEPMIRLFAKNADECIKKISLILNLMNNK